jgi:hypoxanthine phosphoribosyltransferase
MDNDLAEIHRVMAEADCLAGPEQVSAALERMAAAITGELAGDNPLLYCVMNGGIVTTGRLLPHLAFPLEVAYLHATRYGHALRGDQRLEWKVLPTQDPRGRNVLVIDDILDEGHTLQAICQHLRDAGAASVRSAVLVDKNHQRKARPGLRADFTGLDIADRFLFGCGMDYKGHWRNAPGIYALKGH